MVPIPCLLIVMNVALVAAVQGVSFVIKAPFLPADLQVGITLSAAFLIAPRRKQLHLEPQGHACLTSLAAGPIPKTAIASKTLLKQHAHLLRVGRIEGKIPHQFGANSRSGK